MKVCHIFRIAGELSVATLMGFVPALCIAAVAARADWCCLAQGGASFLV